VPGDHAVARHDLPRHPEVATPVCDELVDLLEGTGIEEQVNAFARRQFSVLVLLPHTSLAAALFGAALEI
jgi:hypothetical protein